MGHSDFAAGADTINSDLRLVRRAQSGENAAFDQLLLKYRPRVVEVAMLYTRNRSDAEDTAQEAFINAYRGLQHFRCKCAFYTWLRRIAINSAKNLLRARACDPVASSIDLSDDHGAADRETRLQELETPEELTLIDDIRGMVNATLEALPEAHRTAIIFREIDGLTYREIATAMATPVGTVRSRVFKARDVIDHQLRRVCDGGLGRHYRRRSSPTRA